MGRTLPRVGAVLITVILFFRHRPLRPTRLHYAKINSQVGFWFNPSIPPFTARCIPEAEVNTSTPVVTEDGDAV